jgi:amidase
MLSRATGTKPSLDVLEGLTFGLYEAGCRVTAIEHLIALNTMHRAGRIMARFHAQHDLWLTATLGTPPAKLGTIDIDEQNVIRAMTPLADYVPYTSWQNATGQPAINLPLNWSSDGLPIGVQFVARSGDEMTLLKLAAEIEKASPWAGRRPNIRG